MPKLYPYNWVTSKGTVEKVDYKKDTMYDLWMDFKKKQLQQKNSFYDVNLTGHAEFKKLTNEQKELLKNEYGSVFMENPTEYFFVISADVPKNPHDHSSCILSYSWWHKSDKEKQKATEFFGAAGQLRIRRDYLILQKLKDGFLPIF